MTANDRTSPYQGLTPFDERDSAYFFGREKDARLIVSDLFASSLTLLYGESGVGKSSVLRAGVLPLLRQRDDVLPVVFGTWQSSATSMLKGAVAQAIYATQPSERRYKDEILRIEYEPLPSFLTKAAKLVERQLMIILDQFEEYSLYHPSNDDPFAVQFSETTRLDDPSVSFIVSLREEAVARLDRFESSIPTLFDNYRRIEHLDIEAAREAIGRPLARYNEAHPDEPAMQIDPQFVDQLLEQVQTGRVNLGQQGRGSEVTAKPSSMVRIEAPYLQLVMTRLWNEERDAHSSAIHARTLDRLGGAERIVQTHLDAVMSRFEPAQRDVAARIFELLVTQSGTKIAHSVTDLAAKGGVGRAETEQLLKALEAGTDRVLRSVAPLPERPAEPRYEIFHDRLASAVLAWREKYLKDQELLAAKRVDAPIRTTSIDNLPTKPTVRVAGAGPEPPYELFAEMCNKTRLAFILGAGLSASDRPADTAWRPGSPYPPTAWELTRVLMEESGYLAVDGTLPSFSEIASFYADSRHDHLILTERLAELLVADYQPTRAHRALARALSGAPTVILSTAFDTMMERAFEEIGEPYDLVSNTPREFVDCLSWRAAGTSNIQFAKPEDIRLSDGVPCIYKVYGWFDSSGRTGPVLTEGDEFNVFSQVSLGQLPPAAVRARLSNSHLLFMGMGLKSWSQRMLLTVLRRRDTSRLRAWAIARGVSVLDHSRWRAARVEVFDRDLAELADRFSPARRVEPT